MAIYFNKIDFITPGEYMDKYPELQVCEPAISTWGAGGTNAQWMECEEADIYIHLDMMSRIMCKLANKYKDEKDKIKIKALEEHIPIIMDDTLKVVGNLLGKIKPNAISAILAIAMVVS